MKLLFLDESGDHSLEKIDQDYPIFVLGGIIVERDYYREVMERRVNILKKEFFNDPGIILHTTDIVRGKNGFEVLSDPHLRQEFYAALNTLMRDLEYVVIAYAIRKNEHLQQYGKNAIDPYDYSLEIVIERFCREIGDVDAGGMIFAENRRPDLDDQLELAWMQLRKRGTTYMHSHQLDRRIVDLSLKHKKLNIAGLQIADLVVSPIGRYLLGKPPREDWTIIERKFRRWGSTYWGYGLIVRPHE